MTALSLDGYIRVSDVNGRSGDSYRSPGDQRTIIERLARDNGVTLGEVVTEEDISGKTATEDRELGRLVQKVKDGLSGGLIVWNVKRYSRNWADGIITADAVFAAGGRLIAEDFNHSGMGARSMLSFLLEVAEEDLRQKTATWDRSVGGMIDRGVHAGSTPPLGLDWARDKAGKKLPLVPTKDAPRVLAFFNRCADVSQPAPTWREAVELLGVKSQGAAWNVLHNRVYRGEARSGDKVNATAHKAIVDEDVFLRAQRRMQKAPSAPRTKRAPGSLRGLLQCGTCGGSLTEDRSMKGWRCKKLSCSAKASITHTIIEPIMLAAARAHHAECYAMNPTTLDEIGIGVFEDDLRKADAKLAEAEALADDPDVDDIEHAKLVTKRRKTRDEARRTLQAAESTTGWLSLAPEAVERRLADGDTETTGSFLREMVAAVVKSCGRNSKAPVAERVDVLTAHKPGWMYEAAGIENPNVLVS